MIDWNRVSELRDEIGPEDFDEIVEVFLEEVDAAMDALGDGSASLEEQLHFLKGSSLNLGFQHFADLCQSGEARAARGDTTIDLGALRNSYDASKASFLAEITSRFAA